MDKKDDNEIKNYWSKLLIFLLIVGVGYLTYYKFLVYDKKIINTNVVNDTNDENKDSNEEETASEDEITEIEVNNFDVEKYKIINNSLNEFDLTFLKLENNKKNIIYSPLSIKNALLMLKEGTANNSKTQIENILGNYTSKKYQNSKNMSIANGLFVRDTFKDSMNKNYIDSLKNKYNAEVIYDSFKNADNINSWVSNKTFNLIPNILNNVNDTDFILTNTLAIDMEWVNKIQLDDRPMWWVLYNHEDYSKSILSLTQTGYTPLEFDGAKNKIKSVEIGAVANKYDIVNKIGEENIRNTVGSEYEKWLNEMCNGNDEYAKLMCESYKEDYPTTNDYLDKYVEEINTNYKKISSSTDFSFYDDNDVKIFAKDLKEYNNTTLQYVGIMPKNESLNSFIKNMDYKKINNYVNNLKSIKLDSFEEGYITEIKGFIPMFNFDYKLNLIKDLKYLGISDIFDEKKADLTNITSSNNAYINYALHKANIEFSNEGIKAAAAIQFGGAGATGGGFNYLYDVPVKKIDLTFNKPFMFLIRDKKTGEIWFLGSVYEPKEINCEKDVNMDNFYECN